MQTDDLEILMHSSVAMVAMNRDLTAFWLNGRARRLYPARFEARLILALQSSTHVTQAVEAAMAQAGAITVRLDLLGETVFGSLHRIDGDRLVLEAHPPESPAAKLRGLQRSLSAIADGQRLEPAPPQIKPREMSAEIVGATTASLARIDDYLRAIWLTHDNQPRRLHQIVTEARSLVAAAMTELSDLAEVARADGERVERRPLVLAELFDAIATTRSALARASVLATVFADLPPVLGAPSVVTALLDVILQVIGLPGPSLTTDRTVREDRLILTLRALPQVAPPWDREAMARKRRLAQKIGWSFEVDRAEDGTVTILLIAPLAAGGVPSEAPLASDAEQVTSL